EVAGPVGLVVEQTGADRDENASDAAHTEREDAEWRQDDAAVGTGESPGDIFDAEGGAVAGSALPEPSILLTRLAEVVQRAVLYRDVLRDEVEMSAPVGASAAALLDSGTALSRLAEE